MLFKFLMILPKYSAHKVMDHWHSPGSYATDKCGQSNFTHFTVYSALQLRGFHVLDINQAHTKNLFRGFQTGLVGKGA